MNEVMPTLTAAVSTGNEGVCVYEDIFARAPSRHLIANLGTRLETVGVDGGWRFPLSVNDGTDADNCYLCSPRAQYVDYAAYELSRVGYPLVEMPLREILSGASAVFRRASLDRVVIVNNWLLSTNLYPSGWHGQGLANLLASLAARYPGHAILFRSLNARQNPKLLPALQRAGARLLASRVVWHYDGALALFTSTPNYQRDLRLSEKSGWEIVVHDDLCAHNMVAFARLYEQLYVEKYTALNPRYTAHYLAECHAHRLLHFHGLRERATGRWLGVLGCFERDGALTAPIVGYDIRLPQALGLYRALMALVLRETARCGLLLNLSAGAGRFKQLRGGEPSAEFTAVFDAHLPRSRRWPWQVLATLSNRVALPLAWRMEVGR